MKCCDLLFSLCTRQRHHSANAGNNNSLAMGNNNNNKADRLLWLEQPTSIVVKNPLPERNQQPSAAHEAAMATAARVLERRLSWSPRRCRLDDDATKPYQHEWCVSDPATVHQAPAATVVVDLNNCRSLPCSLDFLSPSQPVKTVLMPSSDESSTAAIGAGNGARQHQQPTGLAVSPSDQQVAVVKRRFLRLIGEGDVQLCRMSHSDTVIGKILSSKFLRRWETHHLYLNDAQISSKTPTGFMEESVPYSLIKDISLVLTPPSGTSWLANSGPSVHQLADQAPVAMSSSAPSLATASTSLSGFNGRRCCLVRISLPDGCLLLQTNNAYVRDQWYHSIIWKKNLFRYHQITRRTTRQEVLLKEVKSMVELATTTPLTDHCIAQAPFQVISSLLATEKSTSSQQQQQTSIGMPGGCHYSQSVLEDLLLALSPLLERQPPSREMCAAFSRHCRLHPRSSLVRGLFTSVVHRILKHNVDFGKNPYMRRFVHDYIRVLYAHNDGPQAVRDFVRSAHGEGSACPHPRVLPNLVAVCLAAAFGIFEHRRRHRTQPPELVNVNPSTDKPNEPNVRESHRQPNVWDLDCCLTVLHTVSEYDDWRPGLAQLLQPVPFPDDALADDVFVKGMSPVIGSIGNDSRCSVHQCVLGIREGKEGWFHVICPSSAACSDDGSLWASILRTLLDCCCRRKAFLASMTKMVGACQLLALRDHSSAQEALCLMLEWSLLDADCGDERASLPLQVATTLQSTDSGRKRYFELCDRQLHLKELQQKGGPKKLTLPSRSTDDDLAKLLLNCGSLGNLECLSLAFTHVTSACAEHLIKLPSLRYLNLWSTQFSDAGLQLISEHLHKLQVLNLCETPVTDKGLECLVSMKSLRKLNLNSTSLSASTFEKLKQTLPCLQECDVRYTDAW